MGTNYYALTDVCPHCLRGSAKIHIGKSSVGWRFLFRAYKEFDWDDPGVRWRSREELRQWMIDREVSIENEYGEPMRTEDFFEFTEDKQGESHSHAMEPLDATDFTDREGYEFSEVEFC